MKKLIAILTLICLLVMPIAMSEDIEVPSELEGEEFPEELELELEDIEGIVPEEVIELDPSDTLSLGDLDDGGAVSAEENSSPNTAGIEIADVNFPDDIFRAYILKEIDMNKDGFLSEGEIAEVKEVNVSGKNIEWLDGIEFFTSLESLDCDENELTSLDVSNNIRLGRLECQHNHLNSLIIGNNSNLEDLFCWDNQLTELDITGCPALGSLLCYGNKIAKMDFSGCPRLVEIVQEYGPYYYEDGLIGYLHPDDWGQSDEILLSYDRSTQVYSQGALLYSPDKRIERKLEPVTIGAGESDDGIMYNVELGSNTPIWVSSLLGRGRNTYKTSNSKVVKVDNKKSVITGVKTGKATVKVVSSLGVEISRQVIVKKAPSRISLSKSKMTLIIDDFFDSYQEIRAKLPSGTASRYLTWKSSNPSVAKYDEDHGTIEAKSPGIATITVKTYNGKKASCKVTVKAPEPTMLDLRTDSLYLHIKETFKLVPVIDEGASTTFSYSSKNPKIATVSSKGVITGKKKGTTRIIVKTANGLKETVTVEVSGKKKKDDRLYESGISGIRVFATLSDQFFHSNKTCSKYQGGTYSRVTLETALNYGKEPCPVCSPEARKTVYALEGGSYCHRDKSHAGSKAKKYTYAAAKARGMNVCPICGYE